MAGQFLSAHSQITHQEKPWSWKWLHQTTKEAPVILKLGSASRVLKGDEQGRQDQISKFPKSPNYMRWSTGASTLFPFGDLENLICSLRQAPHEPALVFSFPNSIWERPCLRNSIAQFGIRQWSWLQQSRSQMEFGNEGTQSSSLLKIRNADSSLRMTEPWGAPSAFQYSYGFLKINLTKVDQIF